MKAANTIAVFSYFARREHYHFIYAYRTRQGAIGILFIESHYFGDYTAVAIWADSQILRLIHATNFPGRFRRSKLRKSHFPQRYRSGARYRSHTAIA